MNEDLKIKIDNLKAQGHSVYKVKMAGHEYIYRTVMRGEFKKLQSAAAEDAKAAGEDEVKLAAVLDSNKEKLVVKCLVHPVLTEVDLADLPAGIVDSLSESIMASSGFGADAVPEQL